jgi:hypothetical protein
MTREIRFKKQYKPIGFGHRPDSGTVEGHRNAVAEADERRQYNRRMKELEAEDAARREGVLSKVLGFFFSKSRRY